MRCTGICVFIYDIVITVFIFEFMLRLQDNKVISTCIYVIVYRCFNHITGVGCINVLNTFFFPWFSKMLPIQIFKIFLKFLSNILLWCKFFCETRIFKYFFIKINHFLRVFRTTQWLFQLLLLTKEQNFFL